MQKWLQTRRPRQFIWCGLAAIVLAVPMGRTSAQRRPQEAVPDWPPDLMANLAKLRDAALSSDYAWQKVAHLTENIGPRLSGSPQAQQAVSYVADEMRQLGLDVSLEKTMVPHWVRGEERAELTVFPGQAPGTTQKIVLTALGSSAATPPEGITADVIAVNNFDELAALGRDKVQGRIVVFNNKFDKRMAAQGYADEAYHLDQAYRGRGPLAAKELGAVASLVCSIGNADYRLPHTGGASAAGIPAAALAAEDAELLADLTRQGRVVMHLVMTPQTLPDAESYNVIADLKGSEHPEQIVIVSGHLDSWDLGRGAIDDGAGVAVAMQAVNLCKQLGLQPKRTIRFIAWMNEENGGRGGRTYAAEHKDDLANHVGAIETDNGAGHPVGIMSTLSLSMMAPLRPITKVLAEIGANLMIAGGDIGSDISPMKVSGVPLFDPSQDVRAYFSYHHTAADTLDKIDPKELAENSAVVAVLAYALANMEQTLPHLATSD